MKAQSTPCITLMLLLIAILMLGKADARVIAITDTPAAHIAFTPDSTATHTTFAKTGDLKLNNINMRAMRNFLFRFKEVSTASWYNIDNGFVARFTSGNKTTSVTYKQNGKWVHTITASTEAYLPEEVKTIISDAYYKYDITNVLEIQVPGKQNTIFLVYVQNATSIKILMVYNGERQVLHDYIRAD